MYSVRITSHGVATVLRKRLTLKLTTKNHSSVQMMRMLQVQCGRIQQNAGLTDEPSLMLQLGILRISIEHHS